MVNFIIYFIIYFMFYILLMPILVLLHEVGHAIFALIFTDGNIEIQIGNSKLDISKNIGRLYFKYKGYKSLLHVTFGSVRFEIPKENYKIIAILLGGPLMSLIIFILSVILLSFSSHLNYISQIFLNSVAIFSLVQFLITILPIKYNAFSLPYKGMKSDGYSILKLIFNNKG